MESTSSVGGKVAPTTAESLYDRIGGASAVQAAVEEFYWRVRQDPALQHYFDGLDLFWLRVHQRAFLTSALGGPRLFVGRPLDEAHRGLHIDDQAFDAVAGHLTAVLRDLGVHEPDVLSIGAAVDGLRSQIVTDPGNARSAG